MYKPIRKKSKIGLRIEEMENLKKLKAGKNLKPISQYQTRKLFDIFLVSLNHASNQGIIFYIFGEVGICHCRSDQNYHHSHPNSNKSGMK